MQKVEILCSLNPSDSWYTSDVTTDSNCVCPSNQSQVSKKIGDTILFKCQVNQDQTNTVIMANAIDASSTRNLSNPNNPNNRNNPLTNNNSVTQTNIYNPNNQPVKLTQTQINPNSYLNMNNPNPSFNTATCDETPYDTNPDSWSGLSTDPTCNCPYPLTQKNTNINNNNYYTCAWPVVQ
jgi:hypothetical protein